VFEARNSELVDEKSGVSARLSISAMENLYSSIERRILKNNEKEGTARISDLWGIIPSITGKVELVYEGEQEGPYNVALMLMSGAMKKLFLELYEHPDRSAKLGEKDPYGTLRAWFAAGNEVDLLTEADQKTYETVLAAIPGIEKVLQRRGLDKEDKYLHMELLLHGLSEFEAISKDILGKSMSFKDPLANIFDDMD